METSGAHLCVIELRQRRWAGVRLAQAPHSESPATVSTNGPGVKVTPPQTQQMPAQMLPSSALQSPRCGQLLAGGPCRTPWAGMGVSPSLL